MSNLSATNASLAPVPGTGAPETFTHQGGASAMSVSAAPAPRTITVPFVVGGITSTQNTKTIDLTSMGRKMIFSLYESVELLSLEFTVIITPGSKKRVYYAIDGNDSIDIKDLQMLNSPIAGLVPGAEYGMSMDTILLPSTHSFGRELKAVALGNPVPTLHFGYIGGTPAGTTAEISIRGLITVRVSGAGLISALTF
jgi:hypothetical protein